MMNKKTSNINLTRYVVLSDVSKCLHIAGAVLWSLVGLEQTESGHSAQAVSKLGVACQVIKSQTTTIGSFGESMAAGDVLIRAELNILNLYILCVGEELLGISLLVQTTSAPGKGSTLSVSVLVFEGDMLVFIHSLGVVLGVPVLILDMLLCAAEMALRVNLNLSKLGEVDWLSIWSKDLSLLLLNYFCLSLQLFDLIQSQLLHKGSSIFNCEVIGVFKGTATSYQHK